MKTISNFIYDDSDFENEDYYQVVCCELINDSASEFEVLDKIELIRTALYPTCEIYKELSMLRPRIKSYLKKNSNGVLDVESFEINMNKVIAAANDIVGKILPKDIAIDFRYENRELTYVIRDIHGDLLFNYIGQLVNNKPHGKGIAYYPDGDYYEGSFRDGNRHGKGILRDSNRKILQNGYWKYEEYVEDNIRFYKNLKVAAGSIRNISDIQEIDYEPINIPGIKGDNIFAFPIEGNSMEPNFFEGDIVICKELDSSEEIRDQKIYVIFHEGGLVVKRVKKAILESGSQSFKLISDNYCDFSPYIITPTNESKFFKILMHVKPFISPPSP